MNIYVDLDGVLADFNGFFMSRYGTDPKTYEKEFGEEEFWRMINKIDDFFFHIPPLPDAMLLMAYLQPHDPIILTAASRHRPTSNNEKLRWVEKHFGPQQRVITVLSGRNKHWYCRRGDILIDDWVINADSWRKKGGIWITHENAYETIQELSEIL